MPLEIQSPRTPAASGMGETPMLLLLQDVLDRRWLVDQLIERLLIEHFAFVELARYAIEVVTMFAQHRARVGVGAIEYALYFFIDFARGLLAAVALQVLAGRVDVCPLQLGAARQTDLFAHAIDADHLPRHGRRTLKIVFRAG